MKWQYRVVYRIKREYWQRPEDQEWRLYISQANPSGRSYQNESAVKGIVTKENEYAMRTGGKYEYKAQKYPLTQEWEDL